MKNKVKAAKHINVKDEKSRTIEEMTSGKKAETPQFKRRIQQKRKLAQVQTEDPVKRKKQEEL